MFSKGNDSIMNFCHSVRRTADHTLVVLFTTLKPYIATMYGCIPSNVHCTGFFQTPRLGWPLTNFVMNLIFSKTIEAWGYLSVKEWWSWHCSFWYNTSVWRTDGHLCYSNTSACIACYAIARV